VAVNVLGGMVMAATVFGVQMWNLQVRFEVGFAKTRRSLDFKHTDDAWSFFPLPYFDGFVTVKLEARSPFGMARYLTAEAKPSGCGFTTNAKP
jgi:hypothetical protein